ncbi:MAG: MFS transporter [Deinococcales bacterium]
MTTTSAANTMALTLVPLQAVDLGASPAVIGVLAASLPLLPMLLALRTGSWIDRLGSRTGMLTASLLLALSPVSVLVHPSVAALFVTEVMLGLGNLLAVLASQAFTASVGDADRHEGNFGFYTSFVAAGQVAGPLLAGIVAQWHGYLPAFAATAAVALVGMALTALLPAVGADGDTTSAASGLARARRLLMIPGVQLAAVYTFSIAFAQGVFSSFFPVILQAAGMTTALIGAVLSLRALVSTVLRPFLPALVAQLGSRRSALVVMVALMAAGLVATASGLSPAVAVVVSVVVGIAWGLAPPLTIVMVVSGVAATDLGFALGVRFTVNRLAQLLGPLAIGLVAEGLSLRAGFLASGGLVAASLGYLAIPPWRERRRAG